MPWILGIGEQLIRHPHNVSNVKNRHPTPWMCNGLQRQARELQDKPDLPPAPWSEQPVQADSDGGTTELTIAASTP